MSRTKDRALKAAKEARGGGAFLPFRLDVLRNQALAKLSLYASKLLLDIASQWQLGRNGDASTAFEKVLRARGWRSKATLHNALRELRGSGLIVQTRQVRFISAGYTRWDGWQSTHAAASWICSQRPDL